MTFLNKLKDRIDSITKLKGAVPNPLAPDDIKDARLKICNSCEFLFTPTSQCKKCGCFVKIKTSFAIFECPIGKWSSVKVSKDAE